MSRIPSPIKLKQKTAVIRASPGNNAHPPFTGHNEACAFRHHDSPLRRWRPYAKTDERKARGVENCVPHRE